MRKFSFALTILFLGLTLWAGCKTKVNNDDIINLPRKSFTRGGVNFSLADIDGYKEVNPDSVGWAGFMQQTPENGQITYFFLTGHEIELASPQVRVEYIAKSLPNCGSEQELVDWVKGAFLTPEQQGKLIGESSVTTLDETPVKVTEIQVPTRTVNDSLSRSGKSMAWAYVDAGDRFVAFNFTSVDSSEYVRGMGMFKQLVRSYKKEQ